MAYSKTTWVDDSAPALDAAHLNNIEDGIEAIDLRVSTNESHIATANTNIATNTSDIATLETDISDLQDSFDTSVILRTGTFSGTWNPTLDSTFGLLTYNDYNWIINVHQTAWSVQNGDVVVLSASLNVDGVTLNMVSTRGGSAEDAQYTLIGVKKTTSDYAVVNQ